MQPDTAVPPYSRFNDACSVQVELTMSQIALWNQSKHYMKLCFSTEDMAGLSYILPLMSVNREDKITETPQYNAVQHHL